MFKNFSSFQPSIYISSIQLQTLLPKKKKKKKKKHFFRPPFQRFALDIPIENKTKQNKTNKNKTLKGVLHPRPVFGLFLHFSQNLQQIGNK